MTDQEQIDALKAQVNCLREAALGAISFKHSIYGADMNKLIWKCAFYFWGIVYGMRNPELQEQAEQCWRDNEQTSYYLTPKEAVLWYLGWSKK